MGDHSAIEWTEVHVARFWSNVKKTETCWNWTGGTFGGRYGQFRVGSKKVKAHRFSWWLSGRQIPHGLILCHRCDNEKCVKPDHLFLGTHADNAHDRDAKGRTATGHAPRLPGELNPAAVLTATDVIEIRSRLVTGVKRRSLASEFGVSLSTIHAIARREAWRHLAHP